VPPIRFGASDPGHRALRRRSKLFATKVAVEASLVAIQICGAWGCVETAPFARYLRDAKTYEIAGGSSEILKNTIGKYLEKLVGIAPAPNA